MSRKLISGAKAYLTYFDTAFTTTFDTTYTLNTSFTTSYFTDYNTSQNTLYSLSRQTTASTSAPFTTYFNSVWESTVSTSNSTSRSTQDLICVPYSYNVNTTYTTTFDTVTNSGALTSAFGSGSYVRNTSYGAASSGVSVDINGVETILNNPYAPGCFAGVPCVPSGYQYETTQYFTTALTYFDTLAAAILTTNFTTSWVTDTSYYFNGVNDPIAGIYTCYPANDPSVIAYCGQEGNNCEPCSELISASRTTSAATSSVYFGNAPRQTSRDTSVQANTTWLKYYFINCPDIQCPTTAITLFLTEVPDTPTYRSTSRSTSRNTTYSGVDCYYSAPYTTTFTTTYNTQYTNVQATSQVTTTTFGTEFTTSWTSVAVTTFATEYITSNITGRDTSFPVSTSNITSNQTSWYTS
jgi:hypothetical protein